MFLMCKPYIAASLHPEYAIVRGHLMRPICPNRSQAAQIPFNTCWPHEVRLQLSAQIVSNIYEQDWTNNCIRSYILKHSIIHISSLSSISSSRDFSYELDATNIFQIILRVINKQTPKINYAKTNWPAWIKITSFSIAIAIRKFFTYFISKNDVVPANQVAINFFISLMGRRI